MLSQPGSELKFDSEKSAKKLGLNLGIHVKYLVVHCPRRQGADRGIMGMIPERAS